MRTPSLFAILVFASVSMAFSQASGTTKHSTPWDPVHIISPATNQSVDGTSVSFEYEPPAHRRPQSRPLVFRIQLDSQPAVETVDTSYTFDNVTPGPHAVSVEIMDGKDRPVASSQSVSRFIVAPSEPASVVAEPMLPPSLQKVAMFLPQAAAPLDSGDGSGEMPLLSAIGLGVLVGGMVSAMKTRV